ncbi:MAG: hypothetical protein ACFNZP_00395 [Bifidobacterium dentium]
MAMILDPPAPPQRAKTIRIIPLGRNGYAMILKSDGGAILARLDTETRYLACMSAREIETFAYQLSNELEATR